MSNKLLLSHICNKRHCEAVLTEVWELAQTSSEKGTPSLEPWPRTSTILTKHGTLGSRITGYLAAEYILIIWILINVSFNLGTTFFKHFWKKMLLKSLNFIYLFIFC